MLIKLFVLRTDTIKVAYFCTVEEFQLLHDVSPAEGLNCKCAAEKLRECAKILVGESDLVPR